MPKIEWPRVEMFHLDEHIGLPVSHPASFRKYLRERLIETGITKYYFLDGEEDVPKIVQKVSVELTAAPIDIAFVGIGENGHLAINDSPADFQKPRNPTSSSTSTNPAAASKWERAGSKIFPRSPSGQFPCRCARF